jgi:P pilus assembly chaperone PapD
MRHTAMMSRLAVLVGTALVAVLALSGLAWAATALAVTKTVPAVSGATQVARTANVQAYFNHDMRASTFTSSTFKIRKQGTTTWLGATRSVNNTISPTSTNGSSQSVATLNPNSDLAANTTYQVMVVGGSSGVKDVNGNALGANKSWTFTTVTPPNTTIDPNSGPTGTVASTSASFAFSSSKANSTFQCSLDNSTFAACTSPKSYSGLSQGSHNFRVRAIASGITDQTAASRSWTVDTVAPDTSITAKPNNPSNNASPSFSFSSNEENSSLQCSIDGGSYSACTSPKSLSTLSEGSHIFSARATDAAGNTDQSPAEYTWMVDTVAPDTSIDSNPDALTNSTSASFDFSSNEAGSTFECKLDSGSYATCNSPKSYSSLGGGSHTFSVRVTDAAGNTDQSPAEYTWTVQTIVDTVAPTVINATPAHQTTGVAPSTNVTATFSEDMNPFSISGQTFKLFGAGSPVSAQVTYDQASRTATLNPAQDLEAGATYVAKIIKDVHLNGQNIDGVTDLAGNTINKDTINGDITWYFTVEAPPGVVTAAPKTLNLSPDVFCFPRQEWLTVTNNTPATVTFATVSITGPDAAYFSDNATGLVLPVASGNYFIDPVTFRPGSTLTDKKRSYQATLTYKDSTGATIGNPVELRATTACITV